MVEDAGMWRINPGTLDRDRTREHLAEKSIETRALGRGGKNVNPGDILRNTVLGKRLNDENFTPEEGILSEYEKNLPDDARVLLVMDYDGVMISLAHLEKKVGFKKMYLFSRLIKAADNLVVWTNRLMPQNEKLANSGQFPFLGKKLAERIEKLGYDPATKTTNVQIRAGKSRSGARRLQQMIDEGGHDMVYFVGSSKLDRRIAEGVKIADPRKFVYMDTGHYMI